jgi:Domain of unknown function (DUF4383)
MSSSDATRSMTATPLQTASAAVGAIFLLAGIAGFIPGLTTNYDAMTFAGHENGAELIGVFNVSILHNLVHLAFGIAGIALARSWATARNFLVVGGVVYLGLWVYGLLVRDEMTNANFVPLNEADNWLHLSLGVLMLALGFGLGRQDTRGA